MGKVGNDGNLYNSYISSITQRQTQAGQGAFEFGRTGGTPEADFGSRLEGISSYNQGSAAGTITARGGETLQAVAASLWGDSGLWYKLAQANGLSGDAALSAGQTLRIPAGVIRNTYNAATITPTDPADTLGDVNPTSPQAAPPKKQKCGMIGTILLVVIAIAVTVITKGAAAKFATALVKAATGAATLSGAAAVAATGIGYGLAAAAGSVVSQAVGVATGIQDKFNWKSVGMAFISGAVGGGMGDIGGKSIGAAMIRGAASSAISQGIGVALGLQDKFSWAAVAAAGVGAGAAQAVGRTQFAQNLTAKSEIAGDIYVGMADAMGQAATLSLIQGSDFGDNLIASLPSVLGGAIGRQIGGALSKTFAKTEEPTPVASEAEVTVEPLVIRGKPLEIPKIPTLLDLVLGGKPNQSAAEMKATIEAYNKSFLGKDRKIEVGIDNLGGGAIGSGNSRSIKTTNGLLHFEGVGHAANSVTESIWFRMPGQSTVTRLIGNSAGWDVYSGGDVSFGNLGLRVRHEPVASSAASAGSAIQAAAAPTLMQQRAAFAANRANASAESARFAAGALVDNLPIAGEISGGIALAQDFSWAGLGIFLAGVIPGVPGAGTLKKVGGTAENLTHVKPDYSTIADPPNLLASTKPTPRQVREMKRLNMESNGGILLDDVTGEVMVPSVKSIKGITPPSNEVQVDHKIPVDRGGTRTINNLELRTRANNRAKSNK